MGAWTGSSQSEILEFSFVSESPFDSVSNNILDDAILISASRLH